MWRRRRRLGSRQACTQQPAAAPGSSHAISDTRHVDPHAGHCGLDRRCRRMGASSAGHVSVAVITERNPSIRRRSVATEVPTYGGVSSKEPPGACTCTAPAPLLPGCRLGVLCVCSAGAVVVGPSQPVAAVTSRGGVGGAHCCTGMHFGMRAACPMALIPSAALLGSQASGMKWWCLSIPVASASSNWDGLAPQLHYGSRRAKLR